MAFALHTSQFHGLCSNKNFSKVLQNLPYFWSKKIQIPSCFSVRATTDLVHVEIDSGICCNKSEVTQNERNMIGFSLQIYGKF